MMMKKGPKTHIGTPSPKRNCVCTVGLSTYPPSFHQVTIINHSEHTGVRGSGVFNASLSEKSHQIKRDCIIIQPQAYSIIKKQHG